MISSVPRPVHSGVASGRRVAALPVSPRFGKAARAQDKRAKPTPGRRSSSTRQEDKRISAIMKRLYVTLRKALTPAIKGDLRQREKDIVDALNRIRLHNLETDKLAAAKLAPYKPFRGRA
ncbi:hypothetical protein [Luteibacter jiangsuensis]|jgi:hypothetical protein